VAITPVFYFDLASPYSYLASARVDELLGPDTVWQPILVGALHKHYRRVSWGATPELRAAGIAEIEARARAYELPPIAWPTPYPANSLMAMRAATWAGQQEAGKAFAKAAFQLAFAEGADVTQRAAVLTAADRAGLAAAALDRALDDPDLKLALRTATAGAITAGVYGVPTFDAAGLLWWGDDQLDAAAAYQGLASTAPAGSAN
jgi:2-hydroxychromene-2-carboxylate isomerase